MRIPLHGVGLLLAGNEPHALQKWPPIHGSENNSLHSYHILKDNLIGLYFRIIGGGFGGDLAH